MHMNPEKMDTYSQKKEKRDILCHFLATILFFLMKPEPVPHLMLLNQAR